MEGGGKVRGNPDPRFWAGVLRSHSEISMWCDAFEWFFRLRSDACEGGSMAVSVNEREHGSDSDSL